MNRQEIRDFIYDEFSLCRENLWAKFPNYEIFRNERNKKWFGVIGDVGSKKLGIGNDGKTDLLVIRCDPMMTGSLLRSEGYLPAYHMNKTNWISVVLGSDKPDPEEIKSLIRLSFEIIDNSK